MESRRPRWIAGGAKSIHLKGSTCLRTGLGRIFWNYLHHALYFSRLSGLGSFRSCNSTTFSLSFIFCAIHSKTATVWSWLALRLRKAAFCSMPACSTFPGKYRTRCRRYVAVTYPTHSGCLQLHGSRRVPQSRTLRPRRSLFRHRSTVDHTCSCISRKACLCTGNFLCLQSSNQSDTQESR